MGIHVYLAVFADRVPAATWQVIYDKARRVATQWTPRPLSTAWRQIGAVRVAQYSRDIEASDGLHIVGDAETLTIGESFVFPARLDRAASWCALKGPPAVDDDVLVAVARWMHDPEGAPPWRGLLGAKTQGLPYHALIVALGLLVENALPGTAVMYGELSARDAEQARRGLASIFGEELELPVVMDAPRLRRWLAASLDADVVDEALRLLGPPDPHLEAIAGDLLGRLRRSPDARVRHELEHVVLSCADPARLGAGTRQLLHRAVEAIRSNMVRWELRERIEQWGAARTREALAHRALTSGLRFTSMAWDAIELADLDELAFLFAAACMDTMRLEVRQVVRALVENRTLRQV